MLEEGRTKSNKKLTGSGTKGSPPPPPKPQKKYDLSEWFPPFEDEIHGINCIRSEGELHIQLYGMAVILKEDGTYILTDTSGG